MLNFPEFILVALVVFLVFGIGQLPKLGEAVGQMRRNYRKGIETDDAIDITPAPSAPSGATAAANDVEDADLVDDHRE